MNLIPDLLQAAVSPLNSFLFFRQMMKFMMHLEEKVYSFKVEHCDVRVSFCESDKYEALQLVTAVLHIWLVREIFVQSFSLTTLNHESNPYVHTCIYVFYTLTYSLQRSLK